MRFYAIGFAAVRQVSGGIQTRAATGSIEATDIHSAKVGAEKEMYNLFPPRDGWQGHDFAVSDQTDFALNFVRDWQ